MVGLCMHVRMYVRMNDYIAVCWCHDGGARERG